MKKERYVEKVKFIEKRISEFDSWKQDFFMDEKTRLACYKALQEIAEGCMDLLTMMLKDRGEIPKDDYTNIRLAEERRMIPEEVANTLTELNGLRNRIVHEYNGLDDETALISAEELLEKLKAFLEVVKEWIKNLL